MHQVSFLLKRAHLVTTGFGQKVLFDVPGMTPARLDMLCFIRQRSIRLRWSTCGSATQKSIREATGLHPSTVSKMLKRLEKLGWVRREKNFRDGRLKGVSLTQLGLRKAWQAMRLLFRNRLLLRPFELIARWLRPDQHVFTALDFVCDLVTLIASAFGDTAGFKYDYGARPPPPFFMRYSTDPGDDLPTIARPAGPRRFTAHPKRDYEFWIAPLLRGAPLEIVGPTQEELDFADDETD